MAPAKPLPIETPVTSTNWPATKWPTWISAPTSSSASSSTRNSPTFAFGSTLALAKWPRIGLVTFLALARADAELDGACSRPSPRSAPPTTSHFSTFSTVTGTWLPSTPNSRVMPIFWAISPVRSMRPSLRA